MPAVQEYIEHTNVDIGLVDENPLNPNKMSGRQFDLLVANIAETGFTEAVVVRPVDGRYRIISGHHRFKAAQYLNYQKIPVAINHDPDLSDAAEEFQLIKMNAIKGKLDPTAFVKLYEKHAKDHSDADLQDLFGFADEDEWKKLVEQTGKSLPKELQKKFKEAAAEIKTVDGLAKLLNHLFTIYGDTVPYGFMVFDTGGEKHIWLRITKKTHDHLSLLGDFCIESGRTMDDVMGSILAQIAAGQAAEMMQKVLDATTERSISVLKGVMPTEMNIKAASS